MLTGGQGSEMVHRRLQKRGAIEITQRDQRARARTHITCIASQYSQGIACPAHNNALQPRGLANLINWGQGRRRHRAGAALFQKTLGDTSLIIILSWSRLHLHPIHRLQAAVGGRQGPALAQRAAPAAPAAPCRRRGAPPAGLAGALLRLLLLLCRCCRHRLGSTRTIGCSAALLRRLCLAVLLQQLLPIGGRQRQQAGPLRSQDAAQAARLKCRQRCHGRAAANAAHSCRSSS